MRRFEFSDGKSNKFWEVETDGDWCTTRHGRIGTDGREKRQRYGSAEGAERNAARTIKSKLKKGYVEVSEASEPERDPGVVDDSPLGQLERKLIANHAPSHDDWLVYADMLSTAGDPRGELVTIGVARAQGTGDAKQLRARERALLQQHADAWFGKFVSDDDWRECFGYTLPTGFWGRVRLWVDYDHNGTDIPKALAYALAHPSATFLREIELGLTSAEGDADYAGCIKALAKAGPLLGIRRLLIGDFDRDESEISWVGVGNVSRLWKALPGLEQLTLRGAGISLGLLVSDSLRVLDIDTGGLPGAAGDSLGKARLPKLETLDLWFGTTDYGGTCTAEHARGILTNAGLPALRHLALANADFADDIAGVVATTPLPAGLETLDLSMGTMTDAGAERLLASTAALAELESLDLSDNFLSQAMAARLREALPNAKLDGQKQAEDDWYYVSVGE